MLDEREVHLYAIIFFLHYTVATRGLSCHTIYKEKYEVSTR